MFTDLTNLTRSGHIIALDMDTFHSMRLMEKRGDEYILIDDALPVDEALDIAEGPAIPNAPIPPAHASESWARVEATQ